MSGFLGEQFALPCGGIFARHSQAAATGEAITISAADPLNLVGIIVPGDRVSANSGKFVTFRDGVAVEVAERVNTLTQAREDSTGEHPPEAAAQ